MFKRNQNIFDEMTKKAIKSKKVFDLISNKKIIKKLNKSFLRN